MALFELEIRAFKRLNDEQYNKCRLAKLQDNDCLFVCLCVQKRNIVRNS